MTTSKLVKMFLKKKEKKEKENSYSFLLYIFLDKCLS